MVDSKQSSLSLTHTYSWPHLWLRCVSRCWPLLIKNEPDQHQSRWVVWTHTPVLMLNRCVGAIISLDFNGDLPGDVTLPFGDHTHWMSDWNPKLIHCPVVCHQKKLDGEFETSSLTRPVFLDRSHPVLPRFVPSQTPVTKLQRERAASELRSCASASLTEHVLFDQRPLTFPLRGFQSISTMWQMNFSGSRTQSLFPLSDLWWQRHNNYVETGPAYLPMNLSQSFFLCVLHFLLLGWVFFIQMFHDCLFSSPNPHHSDRNNNKKCPD